MVLIRATFSRTAIQGREHGSLPVITPLITQEARCGDKRFW